NPSIRCCRGAAPVQPPAICCSRTSNAVLNVVKKCFAAASNRDDEELCPLQRRFEVNDASPILRGRSLHHGKPCTESVLCKAPSDTMCSPDRPPWQSPRLAAQHPDVLPAELAPVLRAPNEIRVI